MLKIVLIDAFLYIEHKLNIIKYNNTANNTLLNMRLNVVNSNGQQDQVFRMKLNIFSFKLNIIKICHIFRDFFHIVLLHFQLYK